ATVEQHLRCVRFASRRRAAHDGEHAATDAASDIERSIDRNTIRNVAARAAANGPLGNDDAEWPIAFEAQRDVLVLHIFIEQARQQERSGERAAEGVGGDRSEIENLARG